VNGQFPAVAGEILNVLLKVREQGFASGAAVGR
jgi:hypothetical protein